MQLDDANIRPLLEAAVQAAWNAQAIRADAQRVANAANQLSKARINLLPGQSLPSGGAAASREATLPHTYEITGTFAYPTGGEETVNAAVVARWNELAAELTADYTHFGEWAYSEEMSWGWEDNATERVYSVTLTFTLFVISRVKTV